MCLTEKPLSSAGAIFSARGLGKAFGSITVLQDVSFDIRRGEVVALLGENGAGKSTLSGIIAGARSPTMGTMIWQGRPYVPSQPRDGIRAGIAMIHQEIHLLQDLSVAENILVGHLPTAFGRVDRARMRVRAEQQMRALGLGDVAPETKVRTLKIATQQLIEIAKAMTLDAKLMILDEPTAALGRDETNLLFERVAMLKSRGVSFIYISHRMEEIARIADRILVLRDGRLVATHSSGRTPVPRLLEEMVGRSVETIFPERAPAGRSPMLAVSGLAGTQGRFQDISFEVRAGEIFGIAGIVGAGRTKLVRGIAGIDPLARGRISLGGRDLVLRGPADAARAGIVLIPEDRKREGIVLSQSVEDNMSYPSLDLLSRAACISRGCVRRFALDAIAGFGVKGAPWQKLSSLSGGNQQKVVLAKWLARRPRVIILDEPTRGIDVGARTAIYRLVADLAAGGAAVIIVSSELEEILGLAHRIMVMARGRSRAILEGADATSVKVMEFATA